ncbi:MAG TPA: phosphate ABC transporter permease PstA [Devosia sp.]|jgi:phosphate transport system permease protein|nr:phosphate ABC transporter permease PstA [Devosia sp.]
MSSYSGRRFRNSLAMWLAIAAAAVGLFFLFAILVTLLYKGFTAISPRMFLESTPPPGEDGGLLNAIFGSVVMTVVAVVVATPIGILAGTFLAESSRGHWLGEAAKFINDILLSAPSIIIGLFVYTVLVVPVGHFSAWAGAASLALIALPVINRTTQDMLGLVPNALREAAAALGTPRWKTMMSVIYRAALSGILTGVLLAIARVTGETAPLLFTALNNQFFSTNLGAPMANLPVVIFQFATSPYDDWQKLAWGGALLITVTILVLNIVARWLAGAKSNL